MDVQEIQAVSSKKLGMFLIANGVDAKLGNQLRLGITRNCKHAIRPLHEYVAIVLACMHSEIPSSHNLHDNERDMCQ